jgi:hypothetical protein
MKDYTATVATRIRNLFQVVYIVVLMSSVEDPEVSGLVLSPFFSRIDLLTGMRKLQQLMFRVQCCAVKAEAGFLIRDHTEKKKALR